MPDHALVAAMESLWVEKRGIDSHFGHIEAKLPTDSKLARSFVAVHRGIDPMSCRCRHLVNEATDRVAAVQALAPSDPLRSGNRGRRRSEL
jgi:hypothetical protein